MSTFKNNAVVVDTCNLRLAALKKHLPAKTQVSINGVHYTVAQLIDAYQACLDTRAALLAAQAMVKTALSERDAAEKARQALEHGLKVWVIGRFGPTSPVAHEFGYGPKKAAATSPEAKVLAIARAKATREARHTMGKKQKQKIKGTVVVSTAPADPASDHASQASGEATTANGARATSPNGAALPH